MFAVAIGMMLAAAAAADDNGARTEFSGCVRSSIARAITAKVDPAAFGDFARQTCAAETTSFRNALIAYDVKAGWTRRKAEPDADQQIGDYLSEAGDKFKDAQTAAK